MFGRLTVGPVNPARTMGPPVAAGIYDGIEVHLIAQLANQVRLVLHTAAHWPLLTLRDAIAGPHPLATAEFITLRMCLLKIAGRIIETATRVRIAFAAAYPEAALFRCIALSF
jgi:hypothetical protein